MREVELIQWLLDGDPAIRWQVLRDLQGASAREVDAERARVAREGWGGRLLDQQGPDGRWQSHRKEAYHGLYIPKWTSTTYTMLLLRHLGLPARDEQARAGCRALVDGAEWFPSGGLGYFASRRVAEPCVSAMVLSILEAFAYEEAPRERLARFLLFDQSADGGWNCEIGARHSSFATSAAALEALQFRPPSARTRHAWARGSEFFLRHRVFCSHRTGEPAKVAFLRLAPPIGWQFCALRGLELFARAGAPRDARLEKAIALLLDRRRSDGRWNAVAPPAGALYFALEPAGAPGRWTTLRCLRVLRWWEGGAVARPRGARAVDSDERMAPVRPGRRSMRPRP